MRWHKPNLRSIYGLLGQTPPPSTPATESRVQAVRVAMLDAMASAGLETRHVHLVGRIRYAPDAPALWHVRSDLMSVLSAEIGETRAWLVMDTLAELFKGLLPEGLARGKVRRRPG
jgi:hypothetical protein